MLHYQTLSHLTRDRPSFPLETPVVVRHVVLRLSENPQTHAIDTDRERAWEALCAKLSTIARDCRYAFGNAANVRIVRGAASSDPSEHSINSSVFIRLNKDDRSETGIHIPDCRARLRIDAHTETLTFTLTLDRIKRESTKSFNKNVFDFVDNGKSLDWLHREAWQSAVSPMTEFERIVGGCELGSVITDFRGVIVSAGKEQQAESKRQTSSIKEIDPTLEYYLLNRKSAIEHFLESRSVPAGGEDAVADSVLCTMLDGRALYAAPLVQWGPEAGAVRYLIVTSDMSPQQVGRLVRRLHVLGELRHCALLDFDRGSGKNDLKAAHQKLRYIERSLDDRIVRSRPTADEQHKSSEAGLSPAELRDLNYELTDLNNYAEGGLIYRIGQSMYYATEFKNRVGDLRTNRIEGYQSYDEFVKRFLYQIFSKIEQIDTQYREIGRRIDRWTFLSEANSSFEHHRLIEDSTKQTKQVADNIESLQRTIAHLLENAEKFAAIFFVYYLGSILKAPLTDTFVVPQRLRNLTGISFDYNFLWATIALLVTINMFGNRGYACKNAYKFAKRLGELILRGSLNIVFSRIDRALPPRSRFKGKLSLIERDKFFGPEMGGSAGQNNRTSQDSTID